VTTTAVTGVQRAWHAALVTVTVFALGLQTWIVVDRGESLVNLLSYFTIQSNLLVLASAVVLARGREPDATWWRLLRLAALTGITVTFVVFAVLIGPHLDLVGVDWWCNLLLHDVVPVMALVGFWWIGPRTPLRWSDLAFIAWPVLWLVYTLVRGAVADPGFAFPGEERHAYPYGFIDIDDLGIATVALNCLVVTIVVVLVAAAHIRWSAREPVGTPD